MTDEEHRVAAATCWTEFNRLVDKAVFEIKLMVLLLLLLGALNLSATVLTHL